MEKNELKEAPKKTQVSRICKRNCMQNGKYIFIM